MLKAIILYYSRTGNTEKMANAVAEGLRESANLEATLKLYASMEELVNADIIIIGTPTYHHDMANEIKRLLEEAAFKNARLEGKLGAAFGSYGWSGEAPRLVLEIMEHKLRMRVYKPPLLIRYEPDAKALEECRVFGRQLAAQASQTP